MNKQQKNIESKIYFTHFLNNNLYIILSTIILACVAFYFSYYFFLIINIFKNFIIKYEFCTIIFFPLLSSCLSILLSKHFKKHIYCTIANICLYTSCIMAWVLFYFIIKYNCVFMYTFNAYALPTQIGPVQFSLIFDSLTSVLLIVVLTVASLVHTFSYKYMEHDPNIHIFFSYISLFTFFMLILVCSGSFYHLFFGWEGVGLCSYLLINFWYTRIQANKAAIKAMLVNRVGDIFLTVALLLIYSLFKSLNYGVVFSMVPFLKDTYITLFGFDFKALEVIGVCLFFGAVGKSAQVGLHTWLPDAMEGPTPVSALIHAATMVTAGVFLLARCSPLLEYTEFTLYLVAWFGTFTTFFAGITGFFQNDLKKVIAYSTCSQLGYMVVACGISQYHLGIFHLTNHAFFKALLFLTAGSVIHALSDEQDIRRMGGLMQLLPFSYAMFFIGSLSLMGIPFLTGFYSKDAILEAVFYSYNAAPFAYICLISALFTTYYSIRLLCLTFLQKTSSYISVIKNVHDAPLIMAFPLAVLAVGSIFFGYFFKDLFIGIGTDFWGNSIFILPKNMPVCVSEYCISPLIKLSPFIFTVSAFIICIIIYSTLGFSSKSILDDITSPFFKKTFKVYHKIFIFFNKKWLFDRFYNTFINQFILHWSYHVINKTVDKGIIELLGPYGISLQLYNESKNIFKLQSGLIFVYAFFILLSISLLLFFVLYVPSKFLILFLFCLLLKKM